MSRCPRCGFRVWVAAYWRVMPRGVRRVRMHPLCALLYDQDRDKAKGLL